MCEAQQRQTEASVWVHKFLAEEKYKLQIIADSKSNKKHKNHFHCKFSSHARNRCAVIVAAAKYEMEDEISARRAMLLCK